MFSILKNVYARAMSMCGTSYSLFRGSLILSCVMACAALLCLVLYSSEGHLWAKNLAADLIELPAAVLLISVIGSAVIEDISG